jgi:hypothetical protein
MDPDGVYLRIWDFTPKPEALAEFEEFYGPDGEWVHLFRRSESPRPGSSLRRVFVPGPMRG